jgi:DNA-binding SARP family transcriptional activator/tetratricopeptide (TPR) repeat protein
MEYRVLGPLQVWDGGTRMPLGGPQHEKALAILLAHGGRSVTLDGLIDALWEHDPPATARHQIHKLISHLRRRIPGAIQTEGRGYRILLAHASVDAAHFAELTTAPSIPTLTRALELWRGPALAGIDGAVVRGYAATLDARRLAAIEALTDLRLAAGQAAAVAAELPALIAAHPLRERLRGQLMTALYHCGRQAEALSVYAQTRALLATELGVDPGPELADLHQRVLRGDVPLTPTIRAAPRTLPYDLPDFSGRDGDLERLVATTGAVVINAIDGMAGIGKTALAVHVAHRLAARYPDGQLFCDLHAHTPGRRPVPPDAALDLLLRMLGVAPEAIPEGLDARAARWRGELAGRRVLVVLDNAASAAQVRPLLPGTPQCLALVTSRRRLGALEGAATVSLDVLSEVDGLAFLGAVAGPGRVAAEPEAAAEVIRLCGHLPLAIRIAGSRLRQRPLWSVASFAARLRAHSDRLAELTLEDSGVGTAFALSYEHLEPVQQRMFRLLGVHPGVDFDAYSVAALAGLAPDEAESLLESLVDVHLLRSGAAGRYTFHDLLRRYARGLGTPDADEARQRLHDYYLAATTAATELVSEARTFSPTLAHPPAHLPELTDLDAALRWLAAEHPTLVAVASTVADWQLAYVLRVYFEYRGHFGDWRDTHEAALRHTADDPHGATLIRFNMAAWAMWTGRFAEGMEHLRCVLAGTTGDRQLEATALTNLGMLAHQLHRDAEAAGYLRRALAIDHDNLRTVALAWNNLALTEGRLGQREAAIDHHRAALKLARQIGSRSAERGILLGLGETSLRLGLPAREPFAEALDLARAGRFGMQEGLALDGLAHATGETRYWHEALGIFTDLGVDQANLVRHHLEEPGFPWCDLCRAAPRQGAARPPSVSVGSSVPDGNS